MLTEEQKTARKARRLAQEAADRQRRDVQARMRRQVRRMTDEQIRLEREALDRRFGGTPWMQWTAEDRDWASALMAEEARRDPMNRDGGPEGLRSLLQL